MRHVMVTRVTVVLAAAFVAAAGAFTVLTEPPPSAPAAVPAAEPQAAGTALFQERCGTCHDAASLTPSADLSTFLEGHGDATAEENRRIIDFLSSR